MISISFNPGSADEDMIEVEICVDSLESGVAAAEGGCTRLELCAALSEGGLTPTPALLRALKKCVSVPM